MLQSLRRFAPCPLFSLSPRNRYRHDNDGVHRILGSRVTKRQLVPQGNEAFAAQSIACIRELGLKDDDERINVNGGAIALGHPLGMSGARIVYSAALELQKRQKKYALATMCVGVGQGYAVVLERA